MSNLSVSVLKPVLELEEEMIKEGLHSQVQVYSILLEACLRIYVQIQISAQGWDVTLLFQDYPQSFFDSALYLISRYFQLNDGQRSWAVIIPP